MKKAMKKLMAALLAAALLCALAVPAFADDPSAAPAAPAATASITAPVGSSHVYQIYQIFTGDYNASTGALANVKWGKNGTGTQGEAVDETILNALSGVASTASDSAKLAVITTYANLTGAPLATVTNGSTATVAPGYYLIRDDEDHLPANENHTVYLVKVAGDVTIQPKSDAVPDFNKKLKDTNDTTGQTSGWQDSADYDIGDKIPFRLQGTVSAKFDSYQTYKYVFHDVEEAGLTFDPTSVQVFIGDEETGTLIPASAYKVLTKTAGNVHDTGCTFEIEFEDLKQVPGVHANSTITVTYESTLNENAVLGNQGNVNEAQLEYANNPNGDGTGRTAWDQVIAFTYKVVVNKVKPDHTALEGAEFTLTKKMANGTDQVIAAVKSNATDGTPNAVFTFKGLDDGEYTLTETVTPQGYNTMEPITFRVAADHTITWDIGTRTDILTTLTGEKVTGEITLTSDPAAGSLTTDIVNQAGTVLPVTGGIGTTIFYVIGGGLMVAAVVLLITKKRMENKN